MYNCMGHDRAQANKCMETADMEYTEFKAKWNASHSFLLLRGQSDVIGVNSSKSDVIDIVIQDKCKKACGENVDSSCRPQCQTEMYWCLDHDPVAESDDHDSCVKGVEERYRSFGTQWNASHGSLAATHLA